jgi:hypothetical protein
LLGTENAHSIPHKNNTDTCAPEQHWPINLSTMWKCFIAVLSDEVHRTYQTHMATKHLTYCKCDWGDELVILITVNSILIVSQTGKTNHLK